MVDHVLIIALMALVATGAHYAQQEGMALHFLARMWQRLPSWVQKPLWTCPICMVSVWGIPAALWMGADPCNLPLYLLASAGLAAYLNR